VKFSYPICLEQKKFGIISVTDFGSIPLQSMFIDHSKKFDVYRFFWFFNLLENIYQILVFYQEQRTPPLVLL
jgi:hypothetical protein